MISIVLITDDNYALASRVVCNSIIQNNHKRSLLDINIIGVDLTKENIEKLQKLNSDFAKINIIDLSNRFQSIGFSHPFVSKAALHKFLLPNIFADHNKMLYLDCDVLVCDDLSEFYNMNIDDVYAAVVQDMAGMVNENHHLKMNHQAYFNSGVMLLNLKKMRDDFISEKLIATKESKKFQHFMDQDELNYIFNENVIYVSPKYNLMTPNLHYNNTEIIEFYGLSYNELNEVFKHPTIWHLTHYPKVWNDFESINFKKWYDYIPLFDTYAFLEYQQVSNKNNILELTEKLFQTEHNANEANARAIQAEHNANEANVRATEAQTRAAKAEQSTNEAWKHYQMIENSYSWRVTKPIRLVSRFLKKVLGIKK